MSRQPSPGPSQHTHAQTQMFHQIPLNASAGPSAKLRSKPYVAGITAGAEDVKYQGKYKELKKKVKEIESDNDRLYLKLLLAKKNIRRMNLERAILYERLAQVPPTPGRHTQELPPEADPMFVQQPQGPPEHTRVVDVEDRILEDYMRNNPNARVIQRPDGKVVAIEDPAAHTRGALGLSGPPPPHGIPIVRSGGYESGAPAVYENNDRQLPPPPPLPTIREPPQPLEIRVANNRSPVYQPEPPRHSTGHHSRSHGHSHNHSHSSSHRSRGSSSRHDLEQLQGEPVRLDTLPPAHGHVPAHSRSSSLSGEGHIEPRARRHDIHELTHPHPHVPGSAMPHARADIPSPNLPPSPQSLHSPTQGRSHNHQRVGPGVHLHRQQERDPEVTRQLMQEREKERQRDHEREIEWQQRRVAEEEEMRSLGLWQRDEGLTGPGMSRARSRSDTPASGGAGGGGGGGGGGPALSRPDSAHSYERERERDRDRHSYAAPRLTNLLSHPRDSYYDRGDDRMAHAVSHSRSYPSEYGPGMEGGGGGSSSSRKRSRHDMEVDEERERGDLRSPAEGGSRSGGSADSYDVPRGHMSSVRDEKHMDQDD